MIRIIILILILEACSSRPTRECSNIVEAIGKENKKGINEKFNVQTKTKDNSSYK